MSDKSISEINLLALHERIIKYEQRELQSSKKSFNTSSMGVLSNEIIQLKETCSSEN